MSNHICHSMHGSSCKRPFWEAPTCAAETKTASLVLRLAENEEQARMRFQMAAPAISPCRSCWTP